MQLAKTARRAPRQLAEELKARLEADAEATALVEAVGIAGPGFLNFRLRSDAFVKMASDLLEQGDSVGAGRREEPRNILLEYVSVNPNGPLHVGHARYAAYGNALDRILRFSGYDVSTEFYVNDYGRQMEMFARSIAARYAQLLGLEIDVPDEGYQGEYVREIAERVREQYGDRWLERLESEGLENAGTETLQFFRSAGCELVLEEMREELEMLGVTFGTWISISPVVSHRRFPSVTSSMLFPACAGVWGASRRVRPGVCPRAKWTLR